MASSANVEWRGVLAEVARVGRAVHRRGLAGTLRLAAANLGRLAYLREAHVWYRLSIDSDLESIDLPPGIEVIRGSEADLLSFEDPLTSSHRLARRWIRDGAELWIAQDSGRSRFACWIFHGKMPGLSVRGGWLDLPAGTAGLENAMPLATLQQRTIAPAVWCAIARAMPGRHIETVVTKIEETNLPCRRAIEKVGFRAIASMQLSRIGGHARVALHLHERSSDGFLAEELAR